VLKSQVAVERSERLYQYIWLTTAMRALAESTVVAGSAPRRENPADQSSASVGRGDR
jgi:hypothetical protein